MGEIRLVTWTPGGLARGPYLQRCLDGARRAGHRGFLYLCGTDRLARWVEESLAARAVRATQVGGVVTLRSLAERFPTPRFRASEAEVKLRVWAELRRSGRGSRAPPPTLRHVNELVELWDRVRQEGDRAAALGDPRTAELLAPVLRVEHQLEAEGREDETQARRNLADRIRSAPVRWNFLVVDGFEDYPPLMAELVEALAHHADEALVLAEGDVLCPPTWTPQAADHTSSGPRAVPPEMVERILRREATPGGPPELPHVRLLTCQGGERDEIETIARHLRALLREDPAARILVAMAALPSYAERFAEVFPRFGLVPGVLRPRPARAAREAQPLRRVLSLLGEDLERTALVELLGDLERHGRLDRFFAPGISAADIDRVTLEARCWKGPEAFTSDLRELAEPRPAEAPGEDEGPMAATAPRRERWGAIAEGFGRLFDLLRPLGEAKSPREHLRSVTGVLGELGYAGWGAGNGGSLPASLEPLARHAAWSSAGEERWSLAEFRQFVEVALSLEADRTAGARVARGRPVPITGLHDAGVLDVDHLFLGGLSEANLPADLPSPLLPAATRARLRLDTTEDLVRRERARLGRVLARARRTLWLSYAARSAGREVLPSTFLNDLQAAGRPVRLPRSASSPERELDGRLYAVADAQRSGAAAIGREEEARRFEGVLAQEVRGPRVEAWRSWLRGIRVERFRRSTPRATPYDGPTGEGVAHTIAARRFAAGRFTVHDVQSYLRCAYRFYLERVLRIEAPEEVDGEADRSALGTELHAALFDLQDACRAPDGTLLPLTRPAVETALPALRRRLGTFLERQRPRSVDLDALRYRLLGPADRPNAGALAVFLQGLVEDGEGIVPRHIELPFDDRPARADDPRRDRALRLPSLSLAEAEGEGPKLVGRIDRLGTLVDDPGGLVVDDFKTGRARPKDQDAAREAVPKGLELQLPLYMAAALQGLPSAGADLHPAGLRYLWLSSAQESGPVPFLRPPTKPREVAPQRQRGLALVEIALRHATNAAAGIRQGRFLVNGLFASSEGNCQFARYCPHALGCRFHRARLAGEGTA